MRGPRFFLYSVFAVLASLLVLAGVGIAFEERAAGRAPSQSLPKLKNLKAKIAQQEYELALKNARTDFAAKLETVLKEVLAEGDLEAGTRISTVRKSIETQKTSEDSDPLARARKKIEGSRWNWYRKNEKTRRAIIKLMPNNRVEHTSGRTGAWVLTDKYTAIVGFGDVYIFKFDKNYRKIQISSYKRNSGFDTGLLQGRR